MRPSIGEQLRGTRRILHDVVAPEVTDAYAAEVLRAALANLEMIERAWATVLPFLAWDNDALARLLARVAPLVDTDLAGRIARDCAVTPDPLDAEAQRIHNEALRAILADAVPGLADGGDRTAAVFAAVRSHLRERADRYPLTMAASMLSSR
jgi:hypothetical protein